MPRFVDVNKTIRQGFARLRSKSDHALFGGYTTLGMKKKLGISENRPLADFLPTITIKAKDLAAEITSFNTNGINVPGTFEVSPDTPGVSGSWRPDVRPKIISLPAACL